METMGHHAANINLPIAFRSSIVNTGGFVGSPFTGAVNDTVLLFQSAGDVTGPPSYMIEDNDADLGTSVTITSAGVYIVELHIEEAALQASTIGISQDVDAAGLSARPSFAIGGFLAVANALSVAASAIPMNLTVPVIVTAQQAGDGSVIRFHGSTSGGAAPAGDFNRDTPYYRITRINQATA